MPRTAVSNSMTRAAYKLVERYLETLGETSDPVAARLALAVEVLCTGAADAAYNRALWLIRFAVA